MTRFHRTVRGRDIGRVRDSGQAEHWMPKSLAPLAAPALRVVSRKRRWVRKVPGRRDLRKARRWAGVGPVAAFRPGARPGRLRFSAHEGMQLPASKAVVDAAAVYVCPRDLRLRLLASRCSSSRPAHPTWGWEGWGADACEPLSSLHWLAAFHCTTIWD